MNGRNRLHVSQPGFLTTVQDLGRYHYAHLGIAPGGAADALSLRIGNLLAGNEENAPALEMTLVGGTFEFESAATVVLTGSDFGASIPLYTPTEIPAGGEVRCGPTRSGARCYLCVRGGIEVPLVLGSASTLVLAGLGGFEGRPLKKGDVLAVGDQAVRAPGRMGTGIPKRGRDPRYHGTAGGLVYGRSQRRLSSKRRIRSQCRAAFGAEACASTDGPTGDRGRIAGRDPGTCRR